MQIPMPPGGRKRPAAYRFAWVKTCVNLTQGALAPLPLCAATIAFRPP